MIIPPFFVGKMKVIIRIHIFIIDVWISYFAAINIAVAVYEVHFLLLLLAAYHNRSQLSTKQVLLTLNLPTQITLALKLIAAMPTDTLYQKYLRNHSLKLVNIHFSVTVLEDSPNLKDSSIELLIMRPHLQFQLFHKTNIKNEWSIS